MKSSWPQVSHHGTLALGIDHPNYFPTQVLAEKKQVGKRLPDWRGGIWFDVSEYLVHTHVRDEKLSGTKEWGVDTSLSQRSALTEAEILPPKGGLFIAAKTSSVGAGLGKTSTGSTGRY